MGQNRSSAVMQQRREPKDSLDLFPTPLWATRALLVWIEANVGALSDQTAWEPCAGLGHMVRPLRERFALVHESDVYAHRPAAVRADFLMPGPPLFDDVDWIVTNPPFRLAQQFIERALPIAQGGVAALVRTAFLEGQERHADLFSRQPPTDILQFTERVTMLKDRIAKPHEGSATAYCWCVWRAGVARQVLADGKKTALFHWIPPCKAKLVRPGDFD